MAAVNYWLSQQVSYERPKWRSQRPATPPSFHLRTPDDRDLDAVTWTRATTKSVTDYQGNVHQALSGEVTWEGYRRVRNLFASSATLSTQGVTVEVGATYVVSFYGTGSIAFSGGGSGSLAGTGASTRVYTTVTATTTTLTCTVTGSVTSAQCQRARPGQTAPDEYVSVGILSTPYHGAKVDGVKYFATDDQGRLIDGTRGYDRDGSGAWVESSSVTPIATGLSIGSLQTNRITYSSDLTSGWTDSGAGTRTAAYDSQVGVYTQLRSVGASGVDDFYFAATGFTGSARTEPAMMLRAVSTSGSLVIENASDNTLGKWTVNLSLVSTTRFERLDRFHAAVTVNTEFTATAGGAAGIRFYVASGSVGFDVSLVTKVEAQRVQSLIYSAGSVMAKNADAPVIAAVPTFATQNEGTLVVDFTPQQVASAAVDYVGAARHVLKLGTDTLYSLDGTITLSLGDQFEGVSTSVAVAWETGVGRTAYRDGVAKFTAGAYDGAWGSANVQLAGPMILRELSIYPTALTATQLQALSNG